MIELDGTTSNDIAVDPLSHKLYTSIKFSNNILVMGTESYAISIPVVTYKPPILFVDNYSTWLRCSNIESCIDGNSK